jgi:alpha-beta hydrolase superfamily lysophospholipase
VLAVMWFAQDRFLYFPGPGGPDLAPRLDLAPWPDAESHVGFLPADVPAEPRGTFLVWHGNAGTALDRRYFARALGARGFRVILMEYPGYGARGGELGEAPFVADARAAARRALEEFGAPVYVAGESMGCGVATAVAADPECRVAGVVLITPWADLPDLAQSAYPLLPARWLVRDRYDNVRNLSRYGGPVAVLISERDEVIAPRHAERLHESIASPKRRWVFEGAGHNSWPSAPEERWWDEVVEFVTTTPAAG